MQIFGHLPFANNEMADLQRTLDAVVEQQQATNQVLDRLTNRDEEGKEKVHTAVSRLISCDGIDPSLTRQWLEAVPVASRPLYVAQTVKLVTATCNGAGRTRRSSSESRHPMVNVRERHQDRIFGPQGS